LGTKRGRFEVGESLIAMMPLDDRRPVPEQLLKPELGLFFWAGLEMVRQYSRQDSGLLVTTEEMKDLYTWILIR
jgi:hypothetical protein